MNDQWWTSPLRRPLPYQAAFVEEEENGLQAASIAISQPPKNKGRRPEGYGSKTTLSSRQSRLRLKSEAEVVGEEVEAKTAFQNLSPFSVEEKENDVDGATDDEYVESQRIEVAMADHRKEEEEAADVHAF